MCAECGMGCATMTYLPMLKRFISDLVMLTYSSSSIAGFAPGRPVFLAAHLDLHQQDDFRIHAFNARRLVVRERAFDSLSMHQQAFGLAGLHGELAVLEPLFAAGGVGPLAAAVHYRLWTPNVDG